MKKFLLCVFIILSIAARVSAQYKIYIKIDGVEGESVVKGHEKEIEALSYGNDITNCCTTNTGVGGATSKPQIGKFIFNINLNKASIKLKEMLLRGTHIKTVDISFSKGGERAVDYYKIQLSDVLITQLTEGEASLDEIVKEQISFNPAKIKWTYYPQKQDGTLGDPVTFEWDVAGGK